MAPEVLAGRVAEATGNPLALLELPALGAGGLPSSRCASGNGWNRRSGDGSRRCRHPPARRCCWSRRPTPPSRTCCPWRWRRTAFPADLEPAETAGLLVSERGTVRFQHPLVRSALYQSATATQRRAAHRVLASVFRALSTPRAQERHAWHLAAAAVGPDEEVAAALDAAADAAAARRSYATAMDMQERAAWLSSRGDDRRPADEGREHELPGGPGAGRAGAARPGAGRDRDWRLRTEAQHFRCRILMSGASGGGPGSADRRSQSAGAARSGLVSVHAGERRADQCHARRPAAGAAEGQRAVGLLAGLPDSLAMPALVVRALTLALSGPVAEARSLLARSEEHLRVWDPLESGQVLLVAALAWSLLEEPADRCAGSSGRSARPARPAPPACCRSRCPGSPWRSGAVGSGPPPTRTPTTRWRWRRRPAGGPSCRTAWPRWRRSKRPWAEPKAAGPLPRRRWPWADRRGRPLSRRTRRSRWPCSTGHRRRRGGVRHLEFVAGFAADHELGNPVPAELGRRPGRGARPQRGPGTRPGRGRAGGGRGRADLSADGIRGRGALPRPAGR